MGLAEIKRNVFLPSLFSAVIGVSGMLSGQLVEADAAPITIKATGFPKDTFKLANYAAHFRRDRNGVMVYQSDGDVTGYKWGAAEIAFTGESGLYSLKLYTMSDGDGRCKYLAHINGTAVGDTFLQPKAIDDDRSAIQNKTWTNVTIRKGDILRISSQPSDSEKHGPGKGPSGYHMAHGRWYQVDLTKTGSASAGYSIKRSRAQLSTRSSGPRKTFNACGQCAMKKSSNLVIDAKGKARPILYPGDYHAPQEAVHGVGK